MEGLSIEDCIVTACLEIRNRKGNMMNGTFVKQERNTDHIISGTE